jgi:hypothetical protein
VDRRGSLLVRASVADLIWMSYSLMDQGDGGIRGDGRV